MKYAVSLTALLIAGGLSFAGTANGEALATYRLLTPETALQMAQVAMQRCRDNGHQIAVAVVDRMGGTQVMLRDRFAGPHTPEAARRKAWTAVSFRADTLSISDLTRAGSPQAGARFIPETMMIGGGVPVEAGGSIVAGIGVSGGPGGKDDDSCARAGIEAVKESLEL